MTALSTIAAGTGAIPDMNDNFIATSPAGMYGRRAAATSGLTWGYFGGIAFGATIANGTVALSASNTNYVVASRTTGAVSVATTTTNWNNASAYCRLYLIVAGAAAVTSYTDYRDFISGVDTTSLSTGLSTVTSGLTSLSTSTSTGLSSATSSIGSLSTGLSTTSSSLSSLSTSTSTGLSTSTSDLSSLSTSTSVGLSTATSSIGSLSTSTSTGLSTAASGITSLSTGLSTTVSSLASLSTSVYVPRVQSVTSAATVTPTFSNDAVKITAQAAALTLANPTGAAVDMAGMVIRIKDNGTARALTFDTQYRGIGLPLPSTTVIGKTLYMAMIFNTEDTKWDVVAVGQEV